MKPSVDRASLWRERAEAIQKTLEKKFWNDESNTYHDVYPHDAQTYDVFNYWWHAHAIDVLVDGYLRERDQKFLTKIEKLYEGILQRNGGTIINAYYDDMEWMALALLRAYELTKSAKYKTAIDELWCDIRGGWNEHCGGGIAWRKMQLDYKNTPANAPAAILAVRLYRGFSDEEALRWAIRIFDWLDANLVDPATGFVWDGKNRNGDNKIDKDWEYTYCQGVYIGAAIELYRVTNDKSYKHKALRTVEETLRRLTDRETKLFVETGRGDVGLFKGILMRYLGVYLEQFDDPTVARVLKANAEWVWKHYRSDDIIVGDNWMKPAADTVELGAQLSGVMLFEAVSRMENTIG